ncbi:MAG: formylglycine-generating enzyme family protein [Planctomycetaceae bacterium]
MVAGETKQLTQLALRFSWCPAGTFRMGSPEDSVTHMLNEHPHDVTIARGFWLQQTEVTQTQYEAVMGVNPSHFRGADHPVDSVTWDEAQEFCRRLTSLASETSSGNQYRLPTESEWEYACRAGTSGDFSFGDDQKLFPDHGWGFENSGQATHPVGTKQPNPWSLSDLHGNVSEWCQDLYGDYPRESVTDPTGPGSGDKRVLRGGCWFHVPKYCRSAHREAYPATTRYVGLGFRVIVTLPAETNSESGEAAKGNATDSVRCLLFDQVAAGGSLCSSGFPARAPCWFFTVWVADFQGVWPPHPRPLSPVSRGRGEQGVISGRFSVFGFRFGEPRTGVRGCEFRAFRFCAASLFGCRDSMIGPVICGRLDTREAAKPRRKGGGGLFSSTSTSTSGVGSGRFGLTRSREVAKSRRETQGGAVVCGELPALLSTFSHLLSMAWMPSPPHSRPLSPVSRGRGVDSVVCGRSVEGVVVLGMSE